MGDHSHRQDTVSVQWWVTIVPDSHR